MDPVIEKKPDHVPGVAFLSVFSGAVKITPADRLEGSAGVIGTLIFKIVLSFFFQGPGHG
jgi:hypothetical protein